MNSTILELNDVTIAFDGHVALSGVTFSVNRGESLCITGPSGSGQTLLLKVCAGLVQPTGGTVRRAPVTSASNDNVPGAAFVFEYGGLISNLSVYSNVALPLRYHTSLSEEEIGQRVRAALGRLKIEGLSDVMPARLSLGARKLASIARAIAMRPQIIYYDEPTLGLDGEAARMVESVIREPRGQGVTSIAVSHDVNFVRRFADRAVLLGGGTMLGVGAIAELAHSEEPSVRAFFNESRG